MENKWRNKVNFYFIFPEAIIAMAFALFGFFSGANIQIIVEYKGFFYSLFCLICFIVSTIGLFGLMVAIIPLRKKCEERKLSDFDTEESAKKFIDNLKIPCGKIFIYMILLFLPVIPLFLKAQIKDCLETKKHFQDNSAGNLPSRKN